MRIGNNNQISFKSLNHPIGPFRLNTKMGPVQFCELNLDEKIKNDRWQEIATFFLDNFAAQSSHPFWQLCSKNSPDFNLSVYKNYLKFNLINQYKKLQKNPDATVLIGRNKNRKIVAGIVVEPLHINSRIRSKNTLYVDSLAVDKRYRKNDIASKLMQIISNSTKGRYHNSFLVAYNESVPFYKKLGYVNLPYKNNETFIDAMSRERIDYPDFVSFLIKDARS